MKNLIQLAPALALIALLSSTPASARRHPNCGADDAPTHTHICSQSQRDETLYAQEEASARSDLNCDGISPYDCASHIRQVMERVKDKESRRKHAKNEADHHCGKAAAMIFAPVDKPSEAKVEDKPLPDSKYARGNGKGSAGDWIGGQGSASAASSSTASISGKVPAFDLGSLW